MEKSKADVLITGYLQKIYGFAYKKSFSYDEAEELAAEMTAEAYRALLGAEEIVNPEGYIWRICENTYAKYVSRVKRQSGVSIDEMGDIPYYDEVADDEGETDRLRREIAFLSSQRREIVFRFYYKNEPIRSIASRLAVPVGTVKWHLNKARKELKEGFIMERKIGELGIHPVEATDFGHSGTPGEHGGPEYYLGDKLNLNIVYSVYFEPKNSSEIAEELGVTPVFIEDRIKLLENNGFIVRTKGGRFTTYVQFSLRTYSNEEADAAIEKKREAAKILLDEYVPKIREAVKEIKDVYIPSGNRELLEAAAIFYGIANKCTIDFDSVKLDLSKYRITTLDGGEFIASVQLASECTDPEYVSKIPDGYYNSCGNMWRGPGKYSAVKSWAIDSRLDTRTGAWKNNRYEDYEYVYELINGKLTDRVTNAEKFNRLKKRGFVDDDGKVMIMVYKGDDTDFYDRIPKLDEKIKEQFAAYALEHAMKIAKRYPPQMQDLIVAWYAGSFIGNETAIMALEMMYENGTFKPLTEQERVTANLIMFSDVLPE